MQDFVIESTLKSFKASEANKAEGQGLFKLCDGYISIYHIIF